MFPLDFILYSLHLSWNSRNKFSQKAYVAFINTLTLQSKLKRTESVINEEKQERMHYQLNRI